MTTYVEEIKIRFSPKRKYVWGFFLSLLRLSSRFSLFFGGFLSSGLISALFLGGFFFWSGCSCAVTVSAKPKPKNAINNVCRKNFIFLPSFTGSNDFVNRLICCRLSLKRCLLFNREKTRKSLNIQHKIF